MNNNIEKILKLANDGIDIEESFGLVKRVFCFTLYKTIILKIFKFLQYIAQNTFIICTSIYIVY